MPRVDQIRAKLAEAHIVTPYYQDAEAPGHIEIFWGQDSIFRKMFDKMDLTNVVEIACGRGRHTHQFVDRAGSVTMVDILEPNIAACRRRFEGKQNVSFIVNSGNDIAEIEADTATALFSYDAMVHFEAADVISYIKETARVLRPGGMALLHYSNNEETPEGTYADSGAWRNFFSEKMMRHFANRSGLTTLESAVISWPPQNPGPAIDASHSVAKTGLTSYPVSQPVALKNTGDSVVSPALNGNSRRSKICRANLA